MITRLARTVRNRSRPIFLATGMALIVVEILQPDTMAFVPGVVIVGLGVPNVSTLSDTFAMVRTWAWLHEGRTGHR
jgi:hypothetical protein